MATAFVIDTNVVSELTRPHPNAAVAAFLRENSDLLLRA